VINSHGATQHVHAPLGGHVGDRARTGVMSSSGGGDVNDRSAAVLNHARQDRSATEKGPGQVDRKHAVPGLFRGIKYRTVEEDGRTIEEHIDLPMLVEDRLYHAVHLPGLGDVYLGKACRPAFALDQLHRLESTGYAAIGHNHLRAFAGKSLRSRARDAGRGTRYQRYSVFKLRRNPRPARQARSLE
jgi:hypothetical protein